MVQVYLCDLYVYLRHQAQQLVHPELPRIYPQPERFPLVPLLLFL
jgi:hypothetical protein